MSELNGHAAPLPAPKSREGEGLNWNAPFRWRELLRTLGLLLAGVVAGWGMGWTGVNKTLDQHDAQLRDLRGRADHIDRQLERALDKLDDLGRRLPRGDKGVQAPAPDGWQFCAADSSTGGDEPEESPPVEMLDELPDWNVCARQLELYRLHRDWLQQQRCRGWCSGCWECWIGECDLALNYFGRLQEAHEWAGRTWLTRKFLNDEGTARGFLRGLLCLVGPERFARCWHPPLIPEGLYPDRMPRAEEPSPNNAAGK